MKVSVVRGGGVAGMVVTTTVDTSDLDEDTAGELRGLVTAATLADRSPTGRPDGIRVELSISDPDDDDRRARFDEHDPPDGAGDLVGWVLRCPAGVRTVGR